MLPKGIGLMKVHFADSHNAFESTDIFLKVNVNYMLQTYFAIHKKNYKIKTSYEQINKMKHVIIDSGLFTMMFGADQGKKLDHNFFKGWMDHYIDYINRTPFKNASFVELDVQKKTGPEHAWELRREFKRRINKGTAINVYHLEDENPDKLIKFADYIAVSIPELRIALPRKEMLSVIRYISSKATSKGKRVHLLGCTEKKLMKEFSYCYSCDSTSWASGARYGAFKSELTKEVKVGKIYDSKVGGFEKNRDKFTYTAAGALLLEYTKYAGDQS